MKPDELNIVICGLLYLLLISVCKMYVITVWIIVFAITVFLIEKPSWLGWPDSFVNSHNVRVLVTRLQRNLLTIIITYFIVWKIVCQKIQMFWFDMTTDPDWLKWLRRFIVFVWMLEIKEFLEIILPNKWISIALKNGWQSQMFLSSTGYMTKPFLLKGGHFGKQVDFNVFDQTG